MLSPGTFAEHFYEELCGYMKVWLGEACEMALPLASDCTTVVDQHSAMQTVWLSLFAKEEGEALWSHLGCSRGHH